MMKKERRQQVNMSIPPKLIRKVDEMAAENMLSRSSQMTMILSLYFNEKESHKGEE